MPVTPLLPAATALAIELEEGSGGSQVEAAADEAEGKGQPSGEDPDDF